MRESLKIAGLLLAGILTLGCFGGMEVSSNIQHEFWMYCLLLIVALVMFWLVAEVQMLENEIGNLTEELMYREMEAVYQPPSEPRPFVDINTYHRKDA